MSIIPVCKIAEHTMKLYKYYLSIGVYEIRAMKLANDYFELSIRDKQFNVIDAVLKKISRVRENLSREKSNE